SFRLCRLSPSFCVVGLGATSCPAVSDAVGPPRPRRGPAARSIPVPALPPRYEDRWRSPIPMGCSATAQQARPYRFRLQRRVPRRSYSPAGGSTVPEARSAEADEEQFFDVEILADIGLKYRLHHVEGCVIRILTHL